MNIPENSVVFNRNISIGGGSQCDPLRLVQYDDTLPVLAATLWMSGSKYTPPSGSTIRIRWSKPDGTGAYNPSLGVDEDGVVYVQITQQMTAAHGVGFGNLEITTTEGVKNSDAIPFVVAKNAVQEGQIESGDEWLTVDEILKRVETLQAQVEEDAATASTDAQQAEAAREATETAAETVKQIVAGNEAYTKQESNDRFALAFVTETGKGTTHEIYPDPGSSVVVTAYGYTEQEGGGDPSPKNVRPIKVGGKKLYKFTPDPKELTLHSGSTFKFNLPSGQRGYRNDIPRSNKLYGVIPSQSFTGLEFVTKFQDADNPSYLFIRLSESETTETAKEKLESWSSSGEPLTFWYVAQSGEGEFGTFDYCFGSNAEGTGGFIPLTEPLCDGDYVVSNQDGQCVEVHLYKYLEFTGEENWAYNPEGRIPLYLSDAKPYGKLYCSHAKHVASDPGRLGVVSGGYLTVSPGGQWGDTFSDKETWKSYLSAQASSGTPVTVVYELKSEKTYTHSPVPLIAAPDTTGKVTVSGEKEVSAVYNKSISKAIEELNEAIMKLGGTI